MSVRPILKSLALVAIATPALAFATACSDSTSPSLSRDIHKINHVVVIYLENHSFDNLYGEFPGANGLGSPGALAAAKQGKYRAFHLAMMRREGQWNEADVLETARAVGVDVNRARRDMYAPDVTDEIIANFNLARAIRVFQTPAYIVGTHVVTGNSTDIDFAKEVARAKK